MSSNDRVVYINGRFIPEGQATISFRDRGFLYGDAVFQAIRTFGGRLHKLKDHLGRLYDSCSYMRLDPGVSLERMEELCLDVLKHNIPFLADGEDYWVRPRVTRGVDNKDGTGMRCTLLIECMPLPLSQRAKCFRHGILAATPSIPRTPPRFMSPRAKTHNYINLILGELEVQEQDCEAWALLLDEDGNLAEGKGCNVFVVKNGVVATPKNQFVLAGITRATVMDLATGLGLRMEEKNIDMYDAYTAEEMFFTSTSLCICPVSFLNGTSIGGGKVPGPVTARLTHAFSDMVGMDFVAQYLAKG